MNVDAQQENFKALLEQQGLSCVYMDDNVENWENAVKLEPKAAHYYSYFWVYYQQAVVKERSDKYIPLNMLLTNDTGPIGVWPLSLIAQGDKWKITSNEMEIVAPLITAKYGKEKTKKIFKSCYNALKNLALAHDMEAIKTSGFPSHPGSADWLKLFLEDGATHDDIVYELVTDLTPPLENIRSNYRRRFKSYISKHEKEWQTEVLENIDEKTFKDFADKHAEVAGVITRSYESWEIQRQGTHHNQIFAVVMRNHEDELIGFALAYYNHSEGTYGVGVYDRNLYDKPVSHIAQNKIIETLKEKGVKRYHIGPRFYPGQKNKPTEKEISIAYFKEGFAETMDPRVIMSLSLQNIKG